MLPTVTAAVFFLSAPAAPSPEPPKKLEPPVVKFKGKKLQGKSALMVFEVTNPNRQAVRYTGYGTGTQPDKDGSTISPLYQIEDRKGGVWKSRGLGWCGTGVGPVSIAGKAKVQFTVYIQQGQKDDWEATRVGLRWSPEGEDRKEWLTAWSDPVSRADATVPALVK